LVALLQSLSPYDSQLVFTSSVPVYNYAVVQVPFVFDFLSARLFYSVFAQSTAGSINAVQFFGRLHNFGTLQSESNAVNSIWILNDVEFGSGTSFQGTGLTRIEPASGSLTITAVSNDAFGTTGNGNVDIAQTVTLSIPDNVNALWPQGVTLRVTDVATFAVIGNGQLSIAGIWQMFNVNPRQVSFPSPPQATGENGMVTVLSTGILEWVTTGGVHGDLALHSRVLRNYGDIRCNTSSPCQLAGSGSVAVQNYGTMRVKPV
jgi:hypothetical protein